MSRLRIRRRAGAGFASGSAARLPTPSAVGGGSEVSVPASSAVAAGALTAHDRLLLLRRFPEPGDLVFGQHAVALYVLGRSLDRLARVERDPVVLDREVEHPAHERQQTVRHRRRPLGCRLEQGPYLAPLDFGKRPGPQSLTRPRCGRLPVRFLCGEPLRIRASSRQERLRFFACFSRYSVARSANVIAVRAAFLANAGSWPFAIRWVASRAFLRASTTSIANSGPSVRRRFACL